MYNLDAIISHLRTDSNGFSLTFWQHHQKGLMGGSAILTYNSLQGKIHNSQLRKLLKYCMLPFLQHLFKSPR